MLLLTAPGRRVHHKEYRDLCWSERILNTQHEWYAEAPITVGGDEPNGKAATAHQTLGKVIGAESQPFSDRAYQCPCLRA